MTNQTKLNGRKFQKDFVFVTNKIILRDSRFNALLLFLLRTRSPTPTSSVQQRLFLPNTLVRKAVHALKSGTETTSERRAMTVLGIVFFVFLVAWLPFSILNILAAVCSSCHVKPSLLNLTSWLGYISSNINPVNEVVLQKA